MTTSEVMPADLELLVQTQYEASQTRLTYTLHSPRNVVPFVHKKIEGPAFAGSPEALHRSLIGQIEKLAEGREADGTLVLDKEVEWHLAGLGRDLWDRLFNEEMRLAYRRFRSAVRTLHVISNEPWIPWEMIKPYDDDGEEPLDDKFFAEQFELTRWLAGKRSAAGELVIRQLAFVAGDLPLASDEHELVVGLADPQAGLQDVSPASPSLEALVNLLEKGGVGLLHFAAHGTFDPAMPDQAGIPLADGSAFRPSHLHGLTQTQISRDRPLVFLNVCSSGRQAWSWTGLGGWADRWVRACGCGAFLGTQWKVQDDAAFAFARGFYEALSRGEELGRAVQKARQEARNAMPGDPSWLAYTVYGHPHARVRFGTSGSFLPMPARVPEEVPEGSPTNRARPSARVSRGHRTRSRWIWATAALGLAASIHFAAAPILDLLFSVDQGPTMHLPGRRSSDPTAASTDTTKIRDQNSEVFKAPESDPRSTSVASDTNRDASVDRRGQEPARSDNPKTPESFTGQQNDTSQLVRLTVHPGSFSRNPAEPLYFLNLTNQSEDLIEITHVWFQCSSSDCQIMIRPWSRPLPVRLLVNQVWSTWIAAGKIPPAEQSNAFDNFQIRLSTGEVFRSRKEESVPRRGSVPGGPIDERDFPLLTSSDETSVSDFEQRAEETKPPHR
jgi:hypothetical protein